MKKILTLILAALCLVSVEAKRWIPGGPRTVAVDTFDRADSGTLGANWTDYVAGFGIVSNQASATASSNTIAAYNATTPTANSRVTITLRTTPTASIIPFIAQRWDGNVGYLAQTDGTTLTILRFDSGVPTPIATGTASFVSGDTFGFEFYGSTFVAYRNGASVTLTSSTDASYSTANLAAVGFIPTGSQTFAFDNFVLQNL